MISNHHLRVFAVASVLVTAVRTRTEYPVVFHRCATDPAALEFNARLNVCCSNDDENGTNGYVMSSITCFWHQVAVTLSGNSGLLYPNSFPVGTIKFMSLRPAGRGATAPIQRRPQMLVSAFRRSSTNLWRSRFIRGGQVLNLGIGHLNSFDLAAPILPASTNPQAAVSVKT